MRVKPVRISDISRVLRISSASLISFLHENGYSVRGDFRSPLSGKMVELIRTGYQEGPPFEALTPLTLRAEEWEKQNSDLVGQLHTPPPEPEKEAKEIKKPVLRQSRKHKPKLRIRTIAPSTIHNGRIPVTYLDLDLIQRALALEEENKIKIRDYLRRRNLLEAIAKMG